MKKAILITVLFASSFVLFAQQKDIYYVILTSQPLLEERISKDGIYKNMLEKSEVNKSQPIFYTLASPERKIKEMFYHVEYDVEKLKADRAKHNSGDSRVLDSEIMEVKEMPLAFLNSTNSIIDLDKAFPTMTSESVKTLLEPLRGKKVYVIDRNDIVNNKAKLIEVKYIATRRQQVP